MRYTAALLVLLSAPAVAQWTQMTGTTLNGVAPVHCPTGSPPAYCSGDAATYDFSFFSAGVINAWSGAATDTLRNKLYIWGGGHAAYAGNEMYSIDLSTLSSPYKDRGGSSVPTMSRVTDPSVFHTDCTANADTTPVSVHSYSTTIYLPGIDRVFANWMGINYCGNSRPPQEAWLWNPGSYADSAHGWTPLTISVAGGSNGGGISCVLDSTAVGDSVLCLYPNVGIFRINNFNVGAGTATAAQIISISGLGQFGTTVVVNPETNRIFSIGSDNAGGAGTMWSWDITTGAFINWTAQVTGCADLMGYNYPGLAFDSVKHQITGYVPRTAASASAYNEVFALDEVARTCTLQWGAGDGPAASGSILGPGTASQGIHNRFAYFPSLDKYVVANNPLLNAYTFNFQIAPTITTPASAGPITAGTHGTAYTYTFAATGSTPFTWSKLAGALPPGLTLSSGGVLAGTPTLAGTYNFTVSAHNAGSPDASVAVSQVIAPLCQITSVPFPGGVVNAPYSQTVTVSECASPSYAITSGTLPTGLSINSGSGVIAGTPTVTGLYSFSITVTTTDGSGSPTQPFTALIVAGPGPTNVPVCAGCLIR